MISRLQTSFLELDLEIMHLTECHLLSYQRHKLPRDLIINLRDDLNARLAQSVERWTLNPTVVGSSPTLGVYFVFMDPMTVSDLVVNVVK